VDGPDALVALVDGALLNGTATDPDGFPVGGLTLTWSQVSGPGTATFSDPSLEDPAVTFSQSGIYVLRLTANDSLRTASDEVTITAKCR
jgi:hypothetical protein